MKLPRFEYHSPDTIDEVLALLAEHGDEAKVMAGGQSLVPLLAMRLARPSHVVDVNRVTGMSEISEQGGEIAFGALVRERAAERSLVVRDQLPLLTEALPYIGHVAIRSRGTIGGTVAHADPPGIAVLLKKGSDLVVQLHIRPRRDAALAKVRIGLYFAAQSAAREPVDLSVTSYDVDVPAGEATHRVSAFSYVPTDVDAYSIFAHAHYLATAFRVTATLPDGEVKLLLSIKHWNFDWQENYWFTSPVRLPEGTRLDMEVVYDNSAGNPRNPNSPPKRVTWGFLTTDEMCEVHLRGVAVDPLAHVMTEMTH